MRGISVAVILGAVVAVAFGIHLAERYTGPLELRRTIQQYGNADLMNNSTTYPRRAVDAEGYQLRIARPTHRVASQYWSIDEYVYSVLPPKDIVSVSNYAYDRRYSNVYSFAESFHPAIATDPEVILKVDPDLLLVSSTGRADFADLLRNAGVPVFRMFTDFTTLEEIDRTILLVGHLTGEDSAANRVHDEFQQAVYRATKRKPADSPSPRILGYAGRYSYGDHTLFDDVVRRVGGVNVGAENGLHGYGSINTEQIARWDPEWIVSGAAQGQAKAALQHLMEDPAIALTTAAQTGHILVFENQVFLPMSPFTTAILDALSEALYGNRPKM
ncbi:MAG TPA: ABC transporter substrate-binding protein [Terriglobia bacterium]|nr:ABC transporter substrate-binding protein [Terriglobia bacterium]